MPQATTSKGARTRDTILMHALGLATKVGFEGLTIGRLAGDLRMSKSGLFAHFRSKEALQVAVLETAARRFTEDVIKPALTAPRGEPRVRTLFERWFAWELSGPLPGGCPFVQATFELDDRPGPARDYLVRTQRDWFETLANVARTAVQEGHFRADLDCEQFAYDLDGIIFAYARASRLMKDTNARARAQAAFEAVLAAARRPSLARKAGARRR